jgi:phosphoribosylamine---glycine ligase
MNIFVIGSGGREHAICHAFSKSKRLMRLMCATGNAGIAQTAEIVPIKPDDVFGLADFAAANSVDLTFVGGETSLALGIVDEFEKRGLRIIGPEQAAARLESSKSFAKDFMHRHNIPTAAYKTAYSVAEAIEILEAGEFGSEDTPVVVKADGLAAGKGVVVAAERSEAIDAVKSLGHTVGAEAVSRIVLEECLVGHEVSLLMYCDGESFALMPPTRDHKRIGEGDSGPNTGGMGTITDKSLLNEDQTKRIIREIIEPTLKGCREEGFPFRGVLFLGLMMTEGGAKLLEYNVRFGDPETQAILVRLKTDLTRICDAILDGTLGKLDIKWRKGSSACVILAAAGYPAKPRTGDVIDGLERATEHKKVKVFHSGTALNANGEFITSGGRVLGITARAKSLDRALMRAYKAVDEISWEGMQYRRDIGRT